MNMENSKEPQFKVSTFFEMTPDLVCIAGKDGFLKKVNAAVIEKLGYTEEELFASPIDTFIYPEDRALTIHQRSELHGGKVLINFENRYIKKNGGIIWLEWTSLYFADDEIVFAIAKDITKRKQVEQEVEEKYKKFKSLATHFKASIEQDRKYLAVELHEELAQLASVVKMDVDWIGIKAGELPEPIRKRAEHASVIANLLITTIQRISFAINPMVLEEMGLNATVKWHCKEFSILNGIPCHFTGNYNEKDLTSEIKTDFFRICQEALTNIMYHAHAANVAITIEDIGDKISLTIIDDGKGFMYDPQKQTSGLTRIQERAASINGQLSIQSNPGEGTKICVTVAKPSLQ